MTGGHPEPDRAAPVLHHQRDLPQAELGDEALDHSGVLGDRVAVAGRCDRQPKARVIERHAPEPVPQALDDVPVQKRPRRVSVQPQEHRADALVDVVQLCPVHVEEATLEREQLIAHPRWPGRHHQLPPTRVTIGLGNGSEAP
jgi:hypothetical protein